MHAFYPTKAGKTTFSIRLSSKNLVEKKIIYTEVIGADQLGSRKTQLNHSLLNLDSAKSKHKAQKSCCRN
jgi:hypothetical protein